MSTGNFLNIATVGVLSQLKRGSQVAAGACQRFTTSSLENGADGANISQLQGAVPYAFNTGIVPDDAIRR